MLFEDISINILSYNRLHFLEENIDSIRKNKFLGTINIFDNGSDQKLLDFYIKSIKDKNLNWFSNPKGGTYSDNFNRALKNAVKNKKKYFLAFHDDDYLLPDMLSSQKAILLSNSNCVAVSCNAKVINENSKIIRSKLIYNLGDRKYKKYNNAEEILMQKFSPSTIPFPPIIFKTNIINKVAPLMYDLQKKFTQSIDILVLIELTKFGEIIYNNNCLYASREHILSDSKSFTFFEIQKFVIHSYIKYAANSLPLKKRIIDYYSAIFIRNIIRNMFGFKIFMILKIVITTDYKLISFSNIFKYIIKKIISFKL